MYYEEINVYIYYVDLVGIFVWIINFKIYWCCYIVLILKDDWLKKKILFI